MITHQKNKYVTAWFSRHARELIRKNFRRVYLTRESARPEFLPDVPVVAVANHSSWWDPMLAMYLGHYYFRRDFYGVFAEEQLRRYGIFRLVGAYSVNRDNPHESRRFLKYTRDLLAGTGRLLWIYPQGELLSNDAPVSFKAGFGQIMSLLPQVQLLKMAVSYDFWIDSKPEIVVDLMPLETLTPRRGRGFAEEVATRAAADIQKRLGVVRRIVRDRDTSSLAPLLSQEQGTNVVYDFYRRLKAGFRGERFRKSHAAN